MSILKCFYRYKSAEHALGPPVCNAKTWGRHKPVSSLLPLMMSERIRLNITGMECKLNGGPPAGLITWSVQSYSDTVLLLAYHLAALNMSRLCSRPSTSPSPPNLSSFQSSPPPPSVSRLLEGGGASAIAAAQDTPWPPNLPMKSKHLYFSPLLRLTEKYTDGERSD